MISRLKRAAAAVLDTIEFWAVYLLFLVAVALEPDDSDAFDYWDRP